MLNRGVLLREAGRQQRPGQHMVPTPKKRAGVQLVLAPIKQLSSTVFHALNGGRSVGTASRRSFCLPLAELSGFHALNGGRSVGTRDKEGDKDFKILNQFPCPEWRAFGWHGQDDAGLEDAFDAFPCPEWRAFCWHKRHLRLHRHRPSVSIP